MRGFSGPDYAQLCREAEFDGRLRALPVCPDCGSPILSEQCLPIEEDGFIAYLCESCVEKRMVWTEEVA